MMQLCVLPYIELDVYLLFSLTVVHYLMYIPGPSYVGTIAKVDQSSTSDPTFCKPVCTFEPKLCGYDVLLGLQTECG